MIAIPGGPYVRSGLGDPPSAYKATFTGEDVKPEAVIQVASYLVDRTEVTNAAFAVFARMAKVTGVSMPSYPTSPELIAANGPRYPVAGITWSEARAWCRFLGKELATSDQWEKAMRGGMMLPDGTANPMPRRNLPWGAPITPVPAKLQDTGRPGPAPVGSFAGDVSPYGVLDLAGNLHEWTDSLTSTGGRVTRGGEWESTTTASLVDYLAIENWRPVGNRDFTVGMRCALAGE
jgi:formylglycine-generating enzyme required for sulfatase activity